MENNARVFRVGDELVIHLKSERQSIELVDRTKKFLDKARSVSIFLDERHIGFIKCEARNSQTPNYAETEQGLVTGLINELSSVSIKVPKRIIFNPPCTIVLWQDGTKTIVRCGDDDVFNEEVGYAMALMRKLYGSRKKFKRVLERTSVRQGKANQADLTPLQKQLTQFNNDLNKMRFPSLSV